MLSAHFFSHWYERRESDGDLLLCVPDQAVSIPCHWFVASAFSEKLDAMKPTSLTEKQMVILDASTVGDVQRLVDFFYDRPALQDLDHDVSARLRRLAIDLQAPLLLDACRQWLSFNVVPERAWEMLNDALLEDDDATKKACVNMLRALPSMFAAEQDVTKVSVAALTEMLKQTQLPATENDLFSLAARVIADRFVDDPDKDSLLRLVRFPSMSPAFFFSAVKDSDLLPADEYVSICETFAGAATPDAKSKYCATPRGLTPTLAVLASGSSVEVGFLKGESFGDLKRRISLLLKPGDFLLKDEKGNEINEKRKCQGYKGKEVNLERLVLINFQPVEGTTVTLKLPESKPMGEVKKEVAFNLGKPNVAVTMLFKNKYLQNDETSCSLGLVDEEDILVILNETNENLAEPIEINPLMDRPDPGMTAFDLKGPPGLVDVTTENLIDLSNESDEEDAEDETPTDNAAKDPAVGSGTKKKTKNPGNNKTNPVTKKNKGPPPQPLSKKASSISNLAKPGGDASVNKPFNNYKTRMCNYFKAQGTCPVGPKCQYAHGEKELRSIDHGRPTPPPVAVVNPACRPKMAPTPPTPDAGAAKQKKLSQFSLVTGSSKFNEASNAYQALIGQTWVSKEKGSPTEWEWIQIRFPNPVNVTRVIFQNGRSKFETPDWMQVIGMGTDMKQSNTLLTIEGIVTKNETYAYHALNLNNARQFSVYIFRFRTYGQCHTTPKPYVTSIRDFQIFGYGKDMIK